MTPTEAKDIQLFRFNETAVSRMMYSLVLIFIAVHPLRLIADDMPFLNGDDAPLHGVHDPFVVGRHHDGRSVGVDALENVHDIP